MRIRIGTHPGPTVFVADFNSLFLWIVDNLEGTMATTTATTKQMSNTKKRKPESSVKSDKSKEKTTSFKKPKRKETQEEPHRHARKHADAVENAKRIWNQLRMKNNTPEQNQDYMNQLMPLIRGKAAQVALQHDGSRCVQACVQFGTPEERKDILKEFIQAGMADLSKNQYACFAVLKIIKYCHTDEDSAAKILKTFKGHVSKLAVHAVASRVMDSVFTNFSSKQTSVLRQEFYGPQFALFAADDADKKPPTLMTCLAKAPNKKEQTLEFVRSIINKGMAKTLYGLRYFQELCAEYIAVVNPTEIRQMATTAADHSIHLLSSKQGTRVVAALVAYGTAKDRKRILKSLKGYTRAGLTHPDTYLAILRLVQLTDDTVSIQKNLLNELMVMPDTSTLEEKVSAAASAVTDENKTNQSPLLELALHKNASKLFLMLLMPAGTGRDKILDPYGTSVLFPNPMIAENGQEVPTSKKDAEIRRKELLDFMEGHLIQLCSQHAKELLLSLSGSLVLREVYAASRSESVITAVVDACAAGLNTEDGHDSDQLFDDKIAHHSIRGLLQVDVLADESPLGAAFLDRMGNQVMQIASSSRGAFILAALCKIPAVRDKAVSKVKSSIKALTELSKKANNKAGYEALLKEIS
jgi:pumilio family protein 6